MSVYFEGNGFIDGGQVQNANVSTCNIITSVITTSTIDMLSINGEYQHITNVKDPIQPQDAATKKYVDDLVALSKTIILIGTTGSSIVTNKETGSFNININPLNNIGPSAIFNVTKNDKLRLPHIVRLSAAPGFTGSQISPYVMLKIDWPVNSSIISVSKTGTLFDGQYAVKII